MHVQEMDGDIYLGVEGLEHLLQVGWTFAQGGGALDELVLSPGLG